MVLAVEPHQSWISTTTTSRNLEAFLHIGFHFRSRNTRDGRHQAYFAFDELYPQLLVIDDRYIDQDWLDWQRETFSLRETGRGAMEQDIENIENIEYSSN